MENIETKLSENSDMQAVPQDRLSLMEELVFMATATGAWGTFIGYSLIKAYEFFSGNDASWVGQAMTYALSYAAMFYGACESMPCNVCNSIECECAPRH
ncbi:hypothetical protein KY311_02215 [Candidatus Woesearchaeota archaeon]|nr:hypothetical protein [Candidatus Woesearchaeota archaeon]